MEKETRIDVSVIVPVYNVEKYLRQCLESIIDQTLQNIEILIFNDGSTDDSLKICEEYKKKDKRVRVYSHENRGLGETRNRGIEIARGEYLFFVDSDDYLDEKYIGTLYQKAKESGADIVQGESKMIFEDRDDQILEGDYSMLCDVRIDSENSYEFFKNLFFTHVYKHYAWNKLYKTFFVKGNGLMFGDNKKIFAEDTWFQLQSFHYNPYIAFCTGSYYFYRQRSTSIMHTAKKDLLKRQGIMIEDYADLLRKENGSSLEQKICGMISMDVFTMEALNQIDARGNFFGYRKAIRDIKSYPAIYKSVCDFNKNKAGLLEVNSFRRKYMKIVCFFYKWRCDFLAQLIVWVTYKVSRG